MTDMKNMRNLLILLSVAMLMAGYASASHFYGISLLSTGDSIQLSGFDIVLSDYDLYTGDQAEETGYMASLVSSDGTVLAHSGFDTHYTVIKESVDGYTGMFMNSREEEVLVSEIRMYLPYHPDAEKIVISQASMPDDEIIFEIDVSMYAKSPKQTTEPLMDDQADKIGKQDNGGEDFWEKSSGQDDTEDEMFHKGSLSYPYLVVLVSVVLAVVSAYLFMNRKKSA